MLGIPPKLYLPRTTPATLCLRKGLAHPWFLEYYHERVGDAGEEIGAKGEHGRHFDLIQGRQRGGQANG